MKKATMKTVYSLGGIVYGEYPKSAYITYLISAFKYLNLNDNDDEDIILFDFRDKQFGQPEKTKEEYRDIILKTISGTFEDFMVLTNSGRVFECHGAYPLYDLPKYLMHRL